MKVTESVGNFGSKSTSTDQDGAFRFTGLDGDYTVVVDAGSQYEKAREPVNIARETGGGRLMQVAIQLHFKVDAKPCVRRGAASAVSL